ncbi:GNAT family N-acetyltransferase [Sphingosinicella rhizophila]|uniref:GNAT family N-acetyltransferase n=1 Tax=Sphingosinicella rhizophila TaxID=3050082 RepID=A0ABU3Q7A6_9SPHN|nr:GNAT family N-acetyltransferase [Sphingosinicella sp. GR2756]MDT9599280.1 GNAT family N-acetyltransferase [Sphingosinicella sp. GR2756]
MSAITYRQAGPDDAARLAELGRRTFIDTFGHLYAPEDLAAFLEVHSAESWREQLGDGTLSTCLAEADGAAVAYAKVGPPSLPFQPRGPSVELRQLYVLKQWHGAGVAAALMDWAIAEARTRGGEDLYLSVFIDNHRARRFYERYGFEEVGLYPFKVGNHYDDDRIMRLSLKDRT